MAKRRHRYSSRFSGIYLLLTDRGSVKIEAERIPPGPRAKRERFRWRLTVNGEDKGAFATFGQAEQHIPPELTEAQRT